MILKGVRFKGLTRFADEVSFDFATLGPGVFVIAGPNGSGKSSFADATCAAPLYRECPAREDKRLADNFPTGAGFIHLGFDLDDGAEYLSEIYVKAGKVDAARLYRGKTPIAKGVREHEAEVERLIGPKDAIYASVYGIQGGRQNIRELSPSSRKAVFRHFLQTERLAAMRKRVSERLKAIEGTAKAVHETEADIEWLKEQIASLERQRNERSSQRVGAERVLDEAKASSEALRGAEATLARHESWVSRRESHTKAMERAILLAEEAEATIERCEAVLKIPLDKAPSPDVERKRLDEMAKAEARLAAVIAKADAASESRELSERRAAFLDRVPCHGEGPYAACELLQDARKAKSEIAALLDIIGRLRQEQASLASEIQVKPEVQRRVADLEKRYRIFVQREADRSTIVERRNQAEEVIARQEKAYTEAEEALEHLGEEPPKPPRGVTQEAIGKAVHAHKQAGDTVQEIAQAIAHIDGQMAQHQGTLSRLEQRLAEVQQKANVNDVAALEFLADALGPNGIQAMEIEVAGPDISGVANDLLADTYGSRFSLRIATSTDLASGDGEKEGLSIFVLDAQRGEETKLGNLCGGEQVVVDEALRAALAIYGNRRLERPIRTLWRDEPSAALSEENAQRYAEMLRSTRTVGDFHQVFVIAHNSAVIAAADGVIRIDEAGLIDFRRNG